MTVIVKLSAGKESGAVTKNPIFEYLEMTSHGEWRHNMFFIFQSCMSDLFLKVTMIYN